MTDLIAFSGPAGAGKTTAAHILCSRFGYEHAMFAGGLKAMLRAYLHYRSISHETIDRMVEGDLKEIPTPALCGHSPRQFMLWLGTEFGRDLVHPDFWVETERARLTMTKGKVAYCGLRFPNEAAMIRDMGGLIVRIEGRGALAINHESERHDITPDLVVRNDGTIEDLARRLADIVA